MVARPAKLPSSDGEFDAIGEVGFDWELLFFVWVPCIAFVCGNLVLRNKFMRSLRFAKMIDRMTTDGIVSDSERHAIRNMLSNIGILSAFGASIAVTFVSDTSTFAGAWDTYAAQVYFFMAFASFGTFAIITVNVTVTLLYFDQFTAEQTHALLLEQSLTLFVDPVLAFVRSSALEAWWMFPFGSPAGSLNSALYSTHTRHAQQHRTQPDSAFPS